MGYLGWAIAGALAVIVVIMVMVRTSQNVRGNASAPVGSMSRTWAINRAFETYWPESPARLRAWVAGLQDPYYADVYQWVILVLTGVDRDGVDAKGPMLAHFVHTGIVTQSEALMVAELSIADLRRLAMVMETA